MTRETDARLLFVEERLSLIVCQRAIFFSTSRAQGLAGRLFCTGDQSCPAVLCTRVCACRRTAWASLPWQSFATG